MTQQTPNNLASHRAFRWGWRIGLLTLFGTLVLCVAILQNAGNNPLTFAWIGTRFSEGNPDGGVGYDGQFAYFIARDGAEAVPYIDGPSLRYQRIFYPLLSRALSVGSPDLVPWTLIGINILAHSLGAGLLTYLLVCYGVSPWLGLTYSLWIGALYGIRFDLNEPLCFALALAAIAAYRHERPILTIALLLLSTLTKELGLIFAAGLSLHALSQRKWAWAVLYTGVPLGVFLLWWGFMRLWFGSFPTRYPAAKFHPIPLYGMFTEETPLELLMLIIWLGLPTVILFVSALRNLWRKRELTISIAVLIPAAVFVLGMPDVSWQDPVAAYRVGMPILIAGLLFTADRYPRRIKWLAALWMPSVLVFLMLVGTLST